MSQPDILQKILKRKVEEVVERSARVSMRELSKQIEGVARPRGFVDAIEAKLAQSQSAVIAEIKKAA